MIGEVPTSHRARRIFARVLLVRIPRPKIEELALQTQGVGIFALSEYPAFETDPCGRFFVMIGEVGTAAARRSRRCAAYRRHKAEKEEESTRGILRDAAHSANTK